MTAGLLFPTIARLCELADGQEADFFVLMTLKEQLKTRDGKPYVRVGFRDGQREVAFPIWSDAAWAAECQQWEPGEFYKIRGLYRETSYGPQLEIRKIRPVSEADRQEGFDPADFQPRSRFDPQEMFDELTELAHGQIGEVPLRGLVLHLLMTHREQLLALPAATRNHHAFAGGWVEHVLAVTRTCVYLAEKYAELYPDMRPPLDKSLVVAGGVLHDIGKVRELQPQLTGGAEFTPEGQLIGHVLQGRDMVREAAAECPIDPETLLRLEHIIVAHQRLPEWGAPKPPMTPEALLVHYADDTDAKFQMMAAVFAEDTSPGQFTSRNNGLRQRLYRGGHTNPTRQRGNDSAPNNDSLAGASG
jgi:3'-5' exoribonuclease